MKVEPQKEHAWLKKFLGEWTYESDCDMGPGQPPAKFGGTDSVRALGDVWIVADGRGEMPGGGVGLMVLTLGFDPAKKRFVGTWIGSMMTNLWVYDGELDASGRVLTLNAEGPMMSPEGAASGKTARYKDVFEFKSDDYRVLSSHMLGEDGKWATFMTAHYRRKK